MQEIFAASNDSVRSLQGWPSGSAKAVSPNRSMQFAMLRDKTTVLPD
jgi:hypothetical protein